MEPGRHGARSAVGTESDVLRGIALLGRHCDLVRPVNWVSNLVEIFPIRAIRMALAIAQLLETSTVEESLNEFFL